MFCDAQAARPHFLLLPFQFTEYLKFVLKYEVDFLLSGMESAFLRVDPIQAVLHR